MTTIYVAVPLESAEQAEALPEGTWARSDVGGGIPEETVVRTEAERQPWRNGPAAWSSSEIVGWTALVPVEVEVEYIRESGARRREKTLYVTPWKDPR